MAVISTPPIWQQNRAYSARLDRQFADVFFGEGVIDVASGDFEVTQTSPLTNSVLINTGRAVVAGDDEANQGKYLILSETVLNVVLNAAPPADARIDLVCLRVNDPVAGGPAGDNAEVIVVDGVQSSSPVAPALPDTAIPLAEVLRTAGDTSITNSMITDLRGQALIVPGTALTANGDLLTRNAGAAVAIPVGSAGLPLLADSPIPAYGQVDTGGIANGAVTAAKLASGAVKVIQFSRVENTSSTSTTTFASAVDIPSLSISFTPLSTTSLLLIELTAYANIVNTASANTLNRAGFVSIDYASGFAEVRVGRYLTAASTATAVSEAAVVVRKVLASPGTSAVTIKGRYQAVQDTTLTLLGNIGPTTLTVTEIQP